MTRETAKKIFFWVLIIAIVLTVVFIFSNSLKPKDQSLEDSNMVGGFISSLFPPESDIGKFILEYIRKIAHFTEYGLLGIEAALFIIFFFKKRIATALLSFNFSLVVAVIDESLQYLSDRGPSISDVWIDVGGFAFFTLLTYGIAFAVYLIVSRIGKKSNKTEAGNG